MNHYDQAKELLARIDDILGEEPTKPQEATTAKSLAEMLTEATGLPTVVIEGVATDLDSPFAGAILAAGAARKAYLARQISTAAAETAHNAQ